MRVGLTSGIAALAPASEVVSGHEGFGLWARSANVRILGDSPRLGPREPGGPPPRSFFEVEPARGVEDEPARFPAE
jgi:hypothetical protein